ncbi:2-hydroxychromene-2-carboxylate isomerase [Aspergillus sclerotioniger CBS 115572]|uniref:Glutathione S-transferase kappa n=1 Tax=Aspergillus sclerotioniger CBS 115572 TaxID=1450535 RepID=A0A317X7I7_9EURO|nr:2-hydroxychromene-2-carboxylate isomerase [Aspergillus sclerotioniger CBS 115572]PWY93602.1 2-hydroxychromene-2-carboxylate isomerase [Aspergillus sclerotioniger CBS 115572]
MAVPRINVYLDVVSPFGYIAFSVLKNSPVFAKCNITYVPIFLGGLMHACQNTAPINITNKNTWIDKERTRWARYFSVPIVQTTPEGFPPRTLATQRALCAISQKSPDKLVSAFEALYRSFWVEGNPNIAQPECFGPVLERVLGKSETQTIMEAMNHAEIKAILTANTNRAFNIGAFGIPWFECTNTKGETEGFWGVDHLGQVADFLGLDIKLDRGFRAVL